jgi:hypothetical protein
MSDESSTKAKPASAGILYSYGFLLAALKWMAVGVCGLVVGILVLMIMLISKGSTLPMIVDRQSDGALAPVKVSAIEPTPALVFEYLSYVLPRLYLISDGRQAGLDSLKFLVDERVLRKERDAYQRSESVMVKDNVNWQSAVIRLLPGTPDARTFAISKRLGLIRGMLEGHTTLVSATRNTSERLRWDFDLEIVAPTHQNLWGLRLVGIHVRGMDAPPINVNDLL